MELVLKICPAPGLHNRNTVFGAADASSSSSHRFSLTPCMDKNNNNIGTWMICITYIFDVDTGVTVAAGMVFVVNKLSIVLSF